MNLQFAATAFATAFTIIDPIGMIPLTLAVTASVPVQDRTAIVDRAVLIAAAIILVMGIVGRGILNYLGITLPAFQIAGGILLFLIAVDMLFARKTGTKQTDEETREGAEAENPAIFPLAVPMIAGPGTIATVLLLVNLADGNRERLVIIYVAYGLALFVTWLCMRAANVVLRVLGKEGVNVLTRLLGIILAALAIQFIINGLKDAGFGHG